MLDAIRQIAEHLRIPAIANGGSDEITCFDDIEKFRNDCQASSVMIGRGALKNVSIFREQGGISIVNIPRTKIIHLKNLFRPNFI